MNRSWIVLLCWLLLGLSTGCASGPSGVVIRTFPSTPRAVSELKRGWAEAVVGDYPVMAYTARESTGTLEVVGQQFEPATFGIGVARSAPGLKSAVEGALHRAMQSGAYINVLRDWAITVGQVEPPALPAEVPATADVPQLADGKLTIGMELDFPPMEFIDGFQKQAGADVQLAHVLGQELGVEVVIVDQPFDSLIGELEAGTIDLILSSMAITDERARRVDFVPYLLAGSGILVVKGNPGKIHKPADLCGRTVALQEGTAQIQLMQSVPCD